MNAVSDGYAWNIGNGTYSYSLSGQVYYADSVAKILRQPQWRLDTGVAAGLPLVIELVADPDNLHDGRAIKAVVGDDVVGYIRRSDTGTIHSLFKSLKCSQLPVHAVIEYAYNGDVLYEALVSLDFNPVQVALMIVEGKKPVLAPPIDWEPNHIIARLRLVIASNQALIEWMGENFLEDQVRLRAEIERVPIDIELERRRTVEQAQLNVEIEQAIEEFERLVFEFRASATTSEVIGLGPYRDANGGICYLCEGLTDSSDNRGRVEEIGWVKPGLLYPTDDHVVPQQSVAATFDAVHGIEPDVSLVKAWDLVHNKDNIRTAHFSCNSRKGSKPIEKLTLPFSKPRNYDEGKIVKMRARYKRVRDAKQRCRDLISSNDMFCGDNRVNRDRKMLKERLNEIWVFAKADPI